MRTGSNKQIAVQHRTSVLMYECRRVFLNSRSINKQFMQAIQQRSFRT